ncbi:MAG: 50S ribosomal protein L10 [Alphaproteobacteria bacterium]
MDRSQKQELVTEMREKLLGAKVVVVVQQKGLTVDEVTGLRRSMRAAGAEFKVLKNTLAQRAIEGTDLAGIESFLIGPTAIAFSQDPVGASKVAVNFADKNNKLTIIGGYLDGRVLTSLDLKALAKLPSLDELRAKLLGLLMAPATRIATYTREPAAGLARVIGAYARSQS